jgi:hypothetical protein
MLSAEPVIGAFPPMKPVTSPMIALLSLRTLWNDYDVLAMRSIENIHGVSTDEKLDHLTTLRNEMFSSMQIVEKF